MREGERQGEEREGTGREGGREDGKRKKEKEGRERKRELRCENGGCFGPLKPQSLLTVLLLCILQQGYTSETVPPIWDQGFRYMRLIKPPHTSIINQGNTTQTCLQDNLIFG